MDLAFGYYRRPKTGSGAEPTKPPATCQPLLNSEIRAESGYRHQAKYAKCHNASV
jgi:hypothetical protein